MLPSISINNTSAAYPESINENNNDEVNGLVQEFKNLFNGKEGISTCIKHLLELIKNAIRVNDDPYRFNINNSSVTYIDIDSNDTDHITIGIDNQEPIELPANYKDKELVRTIINDNIVEKTHDINNKEMIFSALKEIYDGDPGFIPDQYRPPAIRQYGNSSTSHGFLVVFVVLSFALQLFFDFCGTPDIVQNVHHGFGR